MYLGKDVSLSKKQQKTAKKRKSYIGKWCYHKTDGKVAYIFVTGYVRKGGTDYATGFGFTQSGNWGTTEQNIFYGVRPKNLLGLANGDALSLLLLKEAEKRGYKTSNFECVVGSTHKAPIDGTISVENDEAGVYRIVGETKCSIVSNIIMSEEGDWAQKKEYFYVGKDQDIEVEVMKEFEMVCVGGIPIHPCYLENVFTWMDASCATWNVTGERKPSGGSASDNSRMTEIRIAYEDKDITLTKDCVSRLLEYYGRA